MNKRGKVFLVSGTLIILLTIFLFFILTEERVTMTWLSFEFLLFAECVLFGGLMIIEHLSSKTSQIILRSGGGFTLIVYSTISMIVSLFYMILVRKSVRSFFSIQAVLIVVAVILFIIIITTANSVKENNDKILNTTNKMNGILDKINLLKNDLQNTVYTKSLNKIAEELRFSDISTTVPSDEELEHKLAKLELALLKEIDTKDVEVNGLLEEMLLLINRRKAEVKTTKVGGI